MAMSDNISLSVIISVFNEASSIVNTLEKINGYLREKK
jgi:hypothetical protein